jgi:Domain of unknown function (DU1801)
MQSKAATVKQYLAELPADRRQAIEAVRKVILANIDKTFEEGMQYGMIGYYVPHKFFPAGYHCDPRQPLPFACLASQKNHMSLYLMSAYGEGLEEDWFRAQWAKTGKKLDMGKCCIRFKKLDDLALEVIGEAIRRVPAKGYVERYVAFLEKHNLNKKSKGSGAKVAKPATVAKAKSQKKAPPKKAAPKKIAAKKTPARKTTSRSR